MKFLFWLILLAILAVFISLLPPINAGYALFIFPPFRVEMSFSVFILCIGFIVFALMLLFKLGASVMGLPKKVQQWREKSQKNIARKHGYRAMIALIEGQINQAQEAVEKALLYEKDTDARTAIALVGAKAAHLLHDFTQRDAYLQQIPVSENQLNLAAAMLKAEMLMEERKTDEALALIGQIRQAWPKLIPAMQLELRILQQEGNALRIIELVDQLDKLGGLTAHNVARIRQSAYALHISKILNGKILENWWNKLPDHIKNTATIVLMVARRLVQFENKIMAKHIIENCLDNFWDAALIDYYGQLGLENAALNNQLQKAEQWAQHHHNDAQLLLTLGRLCVASRLWGKAQNYFEASLGLEPSAIIHAELGRLFEALGQQEKTIYHYRQSIDLSQ